MALIDPGKMVSNMIKAMGVSQDDIANVVGLIQSLNAMLAEKEELKTAFGAWTKHYDRRLDRIEAMLSSLGASVPSNVRQLPNGKVTDHGKETG